MRIVHVVQGLGIGGQEALVVSLSRQLAARGHDVAIVTLSPGGDLRAEAEVVPVYDAPRAAGADPALVVRLLCLLRALRAEVVHTHNPAPLLHGGPAGLLARVPRRIHTKHGANRYGVRALWAARGVVRTLHALVAVSPQTAAVARRKERVPQERLRVVPNGIPLGAFGPDSSTRERMRRELGIPSEALVVGSVGRLAVEKDYPLLVRAMSPLLSEHVRLVIVGEGDARADTVAQLAQMPRGLARFVVLTGARRDVPALLAAFDLFVLSSRTEGLPLSVPEAMASALPVVATAVGGLPSVVDGACGILVPAGDEHALRGAIARLAGDRERCRSMGDRARRLALARFSIEATADAYERIYAGG